MTRAAIVRIDEALYSPKRSRIFDPMYNRGGPASQPGVRLLPRALGLGDPLERTGPDVSHTARPKSPLNATLDAGRVPQQ
jgi:hypothetical protein